MAAAVRAADALNTEPVPQGYATGVLGNRLALTVTLNAATKDVQADKGRVRYSDPSLQGFRPIM